MRGFKEKDFGERRDAAVKARLEALEKFKAGTAEDDPSVIAKRAARQAIVEAREVRLAEKAAQKLIDEENERLAAIERAAIAAREAEEARLREIELEKERKAARDARYAARKARKR